MPATIHARLENPTAAAPCAVLTREHRNGSVEERTVAPRGRLDLNEAAAVLGESPDDVRRSMRAGLLDARRHGTRWVITLQACLRYLRELADDIAYLDAHQGEPTIPAEEVPSGRRASTSRTSRCTPAVSQAARVPR